MKCTVQMTSGGTINVPSLITIATIVEDVMLVLLIEGIYDVRR
jgi:hypothetical protein